MAMVWQAVGALTSAPPTPVIHSPDIANLCSLASMTMMFMGVHESEFLKMAQALYRHCKEQEPETFNALVDEFLDLKVANRALNRDEMIPEEQRDYDIRSAELRQDMLEAIQHIVSQDG
jgi:hypothetical protein